MENKHVRLFAVVVLCFSRSAWGQGPEAEYLKGEINTGSSAIARTEVILSDPQTNRTFGVDVGTDGSFVFRHVPYGRYSLTVVDRDGHSMHEEMVSVQGQNQPIYVQVTQPAIARAPSGTVSAAQLLHPPTKKAFQSFMAARKLADAGAHEKAAEQLEKAVRLSPDFANAWVNLAAQHIYMKRYDEAMQELEHASQIDRPTATILGNLAFIHFTLRHLEEAARFARESLRLDPSFAPSHYMLGSFLASDRRTLAEGLQHLEIAARSMPSAQVTLDRVKRDLAQTVTHP